MAALALAPSIAGASTYCVGVSGADCAFGYAATGAGLQSALDDADNNIDIGGTPDTVRIGPGSFAAPHGFRTIGGDLSIVGAGDSTVLTSTGGTQNDTVLALKPAGSPAASVRLLQVQLTSTQASAIWDFRQVADVHIGGPGTLYDKGIRLPEGGRVTRTLIDPAKISAGAAITATSGVIEDTLIQVRAAGGPNYTIGLEAQSPLNPGASVLTVRHVTILGNSAPLTIGILGQGSRSSAGAVSETVHVRDSLVRGLNFALSRQGQAANALPACSPFCFDAVANIDSRYSSLAAMPTQDAGPGAITAGPGDLGDPEPVLASDGSPQTGSPLIDAGDPAGAEAGDSATDVAGHARIVGGRRDIGAFEFVPAPVALPSTPPSITPPVPDPAPSHQAPVISALRLSHRRFRVGAPPRRGTTARFTLSATASYTLRIDRVLQGRILTRPGKPSVCRATKGRTKASHGKPCRSYKTAGTLTGTHVSGPVSVAFSGRLGPKRLQPGTYRLTVEAHDSAGGVAQPQGVTFTVVR